MEASHECVHTRLAYRCLAAVLLKSARTHTCAEYKVRLNELVRDTLLKKIDCIFFARKKIVSRGGMMTSANTVHCTVRGSGGCGIASSFSPHPRVTSSSSMRKSSCNDCFRYRIDARGSGFLSLLFPLLSFSRARVAAFT
jgi:hypothetical protein